VSATVLEHRGRGRPPCCPPELAVRVIHLQAEGLSYGRIAALLNAEGVPTPGTIGRSTEVTAAAIRAGE